MCRNESFEPFEGVEDGDDADAEGVEAVDDVDVDVDVDVFVVADVGEGLIVEAAAKRADERREPIVGVEA